jgi:eukaryotic-like serine/threonine-protein kinase
MLPAAERAVTDARFAAPERLTGRETPDQRADIYSLGALLAFLVSGAPPYDGDREAIQCAHAVGRGFDLRARRPKAARETASLVGSFLALDRENRPKDWDAALGAIESAVARLAGEAEPASWLDRFTAAIAGRPALTCTLAVTPIVLAGVVLHLALNDEPAARHAAKSAQPGAADTAAPARDR